MPTTFGIVYATGSKMIRRIIIPDDDASLTNGTHGVGAGETLLVTADQGDHSIANCQALVKAATGVTPADPRCAVVDVTNTVVLMIMADPAIDSHPAGTLISDYSGGVVDKGFTWDPVGQLFSSPVIVFLPGTRLIATGVFNTTTITIPAAVIARPVITGA